MSFEVKKAKRQRRPLKINLEGLSGTGKTFTALRLAFAMRRAGIGKKIVVADSENESAGLYDGITIDGEKWEYDVCPIPSEKQNPAGYTEAYNYLVGAGYDIIIGDSLTHAWHGAMEQVDAFAKANRNDKFSGWAQVTPEQRKMLSTLTDGRAHFIGTMRVKAEYDMVVNARTGKEQRQKVGLKTDQRDGAEYEFDCVVRLDLGHEARVEKVRGCMAMDGKTGTNPGPEFWKPLLDWWLSAPEAENPIEEATKRLNAATDAASLVAAWNSIPVNIQKQVLAVKDARKAELMKPSTPEDKQPQNPTSAPNAGSGSPTPAANSAPSASTSEKQQPQPEGKIGSDIQGKISQLFQTVGLYFDQVRRNQLTEELEPGEGICELLKIEPNEKLKLSDLDVAPGLVLYGMLQAKAKKKSGKRETVGV
jgi:hypothetical protein